MSAHIPETLKDQWQRVVAGLGVRPVIDSLITMYRVELHELHSAERQFGILADKIGLVIHYAPLAGRLSEYAAAVRRREIETRRLLGAVGAEYRMRPNEVMRALVQKASSMAEQSSENVRDAALVAALQGLIHYMIAEHGTLESLANALGRKDEAARFALHAHLYKEADRELSELATSTLNLTAARTANSPGKTG